MTRNWEIGWNKIEREANETQRLLDELKYRRRSTMNSTYERHEDLSIRLKRTNAILDELLK